MKTITLVSIILTIIMFIVTIFVIPFVLLNNYNKYIIIIPIILFLIPHITLAYSIGEEENMLAAIIYGILGLAVWIGCTGINYSID